MDQKLIRNAALFEQLAFDLQIDEVEPDVSISPEEARQRSEASQGKLEALRQVMATALSKKENEAVQVNQAREDLPLWLEDYFLLREAHWPWRVAAYIAWAGSPRQQRWPHTQLQLAQNVLGLNSDRVILTWRQKNPAIDETVALMQSAPLYQYRRDIYDALIQSASDPDYRSHQDRKLALEMMGDFVPRAQVDLKRPVDPNDLSEYSTAELKQIAKSALSAAKEKVQEEEEPHGD